MKFNKPCVTFWCVWTKNTKVWEILRKFSKIFKKFLQKFVKMLYFTIFFTRFHKPMRSFFAVLTKNNLLGNVEKIMQIFDENSIEKLNFIMISRKFVTKNRAFGNNPIFLQQFFRLREDFHPSPPKSANGIGFC